MVDPDALYIVLPVLFVSFAAVPAVPFLVRLYRQWRESVMRDVLRLRVSGWYGSLRRLARCKDPNRNGCEHVSGRHACRHSRMAGGLR